MPVKVAVGYGRRICASTGEEAFGTLRKIKIVDNNPSHLTKRHYTTGLCEGSISAGFTFPAHSD